MEISFTGRKALVTGATKGIGREIAKQLARCGASVIAVGRSVSLLESLKAEFPSIQTVAVNLADWSATRTALKDFTDIDLLVNNAGIAILDPVEDITEDHVDQLFDINVKTVINLTQFVASNLKARHQPGSIVNISSQASIAGLADHSVYCATKGAVDGFMRACAVELGPYNIRVNSVNPTVIMTDMGKKGWSDPAKAEPMKAKIPLHRFGEVSEVVDAVLYLLSDRASMITGVCLPIDGGYVAS